MNPWIDVAGWTLVHFLWEGATIALLALVALWGLRHRSPQARYAVACASLVAMLAAPIVTAAVLSRAVVVIAPAAVQRTAEAQPDTLAIPDATSASADAASLAINVLMARNGSSVDVRAGGSRAWLPLVVMLWFAGVAALLIRLLGGWWRITRLHRAARAAAPSAWTAAAARIAATLGLSRRVHVVDSSLVDTPTVIGWVKPVILLPIAAFAGLSPTQVEAILAHELAHVRRHDFLVNLLQTFAETVLFYHPAIWWVSARIRAEREHCCDVVALSVCGDAVSYAEALVELESWRTVHSRLAIAATGGKLLTRVRRLLGAPADDAPRSLGAMLIAGVGCARDLRRRRVALPRCRAARCRCGAACAGRRRSRSRGVVDGLQPQRLVDALHRLPRPRSDSLRLPDSRGTYHRRAALARRADPADRHQPGCRAARGRDAGHRPAGARGHVCIEDARGEAQLPGARAGHGQAGPRIRTQPSRVESSVLRPAAVDCCRATSGPAPGVATCAALRGRPRQLVGLDAALVGDDAGLRGVPARLREGVAVYSKETPAPARSRPGARRAQKHAPDIVDRTGLSGRYDFEFSAFYPTAALMSRFPFLKNVFEPMGFTSIPRALEDQLGLALVESEAAVRRHRHRQRGTPVHRRGRLQAAREIS